MIVLYAIVGGIAGLGIYALAVFFLVAGASETEKNPIVASLLTLLTSPLIGLAYARPEAWMTGLASTIIFFAPLGIAAGFLIAAGNIAIGAAIIAYLVIAGITTAVFMVQDQNDAVAAQEAE